MLRLPNTGAGPCCRTTHLKVIVQKVTGMAASRIMTPKQKQTKKYLIVSYTCSNHIVIAFLIRLRVIVTRCHKSFSGSTGIIS
jgi:hypothetical protein